MTPAEQPSAAVPAANVMIPAAATADLEAPEVVAGDVARVGSTIDRWALVSIYLGLAFTMVNVQQFAAAGAAPWTLPWLAAWLLDPMVSILLLVVVRAEQITARWQVSLGWKVTAAKWVFFAATYVMNTWASWRDQVPSLIVLHSIPPILVLIGAEVLPVLREGLTEAVLKARRYAETAARTTLPADPRAPEPTTTPTPPHAHTTGSRPAGAPHDEARDLGRPPTPSQPTPTPTATPTEDARANGQVEHGAPAADVRSQRSPEPAVHEPASCAEQIGAPNEAPTTPPETGAVRRGESSVFGPQPYDVPLEFDPPPPTDVDAALQAGTGSSVPEPDGDDESDPATGDDLDARVVLLAEILRDTPDLGGPGAEAALRAAGFQPMSGRTARRLLGKARDAAAAPPPAAPDELGPSTTSTGEQAPTGTEPERPTALSLVPRHSTALTSEDRT